jgi:succinate-semialdehyde dehydrogenase/glutarate-semialdehyde dehydrogenase
MYQDVLLHIDGEWVSGSAGGTLDIVNPATEEVIGVVAVATITDLDRALVAAERGFAAWRRVPALERSKIMRRAADLLRERIDTIAPIVTMENGKPLLQARQETMAASDVIDWFAEEGRRIYGRLIPARAEGIAQIVTREPVGPVAAFTPWNFPVSQVVKKLAAAFAAGCSVIVKASEETPASAAELVRAFVDAGLPSGVVNLVFGVPAEISNYLIPHPVVRKVSFTGSTAVGKMLAALAGQHMKRTTMELGGHAPAIVFNDADVESAATLLASSKFRNAGQVCIAPTRMLVQEKIYDDFLDRFVAKARAIKVGDGLDDTVTMGPVIHPRRVVALEGMIQDAVQRGAVVRTGGKRVGNKGYFLEPTVITDIPADAAAMQNEVFGPVALIRPFREFSDGIDEANRLSYGLASYAYTRSARIAFEVAGALESGMVSINHNGLALAETPFGGVKDSGYGAEGGSEGIEAYVNTKFVSQANLY